MSILFISKDFLRHFRDKPIPYELQNEMRYRNIRYRQYRGKYDEAGALYSSLSGKLRDDQILMRLACHMKKEDIPRMKYLVYIVQQVIKVLVKDSSKKPYASSYCPVLIFELRALAVTLNTFQRKMQRDTLSHLQLYMTKNKFSNPDQLICSEDVHSFQRLTDHFLDLMKEVYDHFNRLLQKESYNEKAIMSISKTGKYFPELIELIEKMFIGLYDIQCLMEKWKTRLRQREMQEVYN